MADTWTVPQTFVTDEVVTAAKTNAHSRDNPDVLSRAVDGDTSTTTIKHRHLTGTNAARPAAGEAGRLYYATDSPKRVYLDDGFNWLTISGEMPAAKAELGIQSIPGPLVALQFGTEAFDNDTIHDNVVNNTRLTCKTAGIYIITGVVNWAANVTGLRLAQIYKNGTTIIGGNQMDAVSAAGVPTKQGVTVLINLAVNDYVELFVSQGSGASLDVVGSPTPSPVFFAMAMVARV